MGRIVVFTLSTIDGAVDDPNRYFPDPDPEATGPAPPTFDDLMEKRMDELIGSQEAVLLGRGMYDEWSRYWPHSDDEFADFINGVKKYVVTSSELDQPWGECVRLSAPLADAVAEVKANVPGNVGVHGSITLVKSLLAEDLVDELVLVVAPVVDPLGRRLYDSVPDLRRLKLHEATTTPSGALWLVYHRQE
jgi:dihydrofolate reductase